MRGSFLVVLVLVTVLLPGLTASGAEWNAPRAGNPVLPGYFADPCCRKFGDTYYHIFRIHDRALSAEEIAAIAEGTKVAGDASPSPDRGFRSTQAAGSWEEALVCGNGKHGAMVLGRPLEETIIINYEHRHCSHLYPLFDGLPDEIADDESLCRAFRRAIELRMEVRRRDGGGIMAFGLVQLGLAAASLREADLAYEALDWLANRFWRANLVSTHDPGSLFNVDLCGGLPALVNRMLVDSRPGWIELLPALPRQWPSGRIEGVRCRGGVAIRLLEWDGERVEVTLRSGATQELQLRIPGGIATIEVVSGGASLAGAGSAAGSRRVKLPAGEDVALRLVRARPASGAATDETR